MIGQSVPRLEDRPLLTGRGRFAADLSREGQLHMRVVRSTVAHGRICRVDTTGVRGLAGVVAVYTAQDLPTGFPPIATRQVGFADMVPYLQPVLATDRVRYVGEPVAVVLAVDEYLAEDAAEKVVVEVDELPVTLDPVVDPVHWDDAGNDTEALRLVEDYGGVDEAFDRADLIVELELSVGRHSGVPMETRGSLAHLDPVSGVLMVEGAAKVPHYNRSAIATMLGIPPARIELHEGHVGGSFGVRGELYPEDVLVAWSALRTGRPVKWIEDRREHLMAANHSRDQVHRIRAAVDSDGVILAIDDEFWLDQGAYVRTHGATVPTLTATLLPGPYRVPAYRVVGHVRLTHKTPAGTYRAPGRYEAAFVRERLVDAIADRLGRDRAEVRRVNLIGVDEMPYRRPMSVLGSQVEYDSGDYAKMLDRVLDHVDYPTLVADLERRRQRG
ncbi:MAG: molybdopterin cofactor-binding domain-containing protein [Acidimicrobiales bacterium]|nr:molybdopterin cofactor-binding domain-containing protein [Acidimicrobiales bacterium]